MVRLDSRSRERLELRDLGAEPWGKSTPSTERRLELCGVGEGDPSVVQSPGRIVYVENSTRSMKSREA